MLEISIYGRLGYTAVTGKMNEYDHPNVMISSTFSDLATHRKAVDDALHRLGFFVVGMEWDSAKAGKDIIESSMGMVEGAHAYLGILSHRYGGVPEDKRRNPENLSITELEYRTALERGIPVFMYVMSEEHLVKPRDVEPVEEYQEKLRALKAVAKSSIVGEFSSVEQLNSLVLQSFSEFKLSEFKRKAPEDTGAAEGPKLPEPPNLLAVPEFVSEQAFVGRWTELVWLDEWAASADPLMIVEAIGGAGKSALAWQWLTKRARKAIPGLAGAIWYSFDEGGADMSRFAAYALAYITQRPLEEFRGRKTSDLARPLLIELHKRPYLLVLDGFERVLVAYHRFNPSQVRDDQVNSDADHRASIKPADAELLRQLAAAAPSRILVTSRLMPADIVNRAGRPFDGVQHRNLRGMDPDDALRLMRDLGIGGNEAAMRRYLTDNFDNHPLMLGIIAGLVNDYIKDPGNFDRWADDPQGGAGLHFSSLQIEQRHSHILAGALNGLQPGVRRLLSQISAFSDAVAFETVEALNPFPDLPQLVAALRELERRGLLHWDRRQNSYDMHPVVRGYAFDILEQPEQTDISNRIVDHFRSKPGDRYENARTLADVQQSIQIFRALVHAGRLDDAAEFFAGDFSDALYFSIEASHDILALLRPLFRDGFQKPPVGVANPHQHAYLLTSAVGALRDLGRFSEALEALVTALRIYFEQADRGATITNLRNLGAILFDNNCLAQAKAALEVALEFAEAIEDHEAQASSYLYLMNHYRRMGRFEEAKAAYEAFQRLPVPPSSATYRPGWIENEYCWLRFHQQSLTGKLLDDSEAAARAANNRSSMRNLTGLRGEWALLGGDLPTAESYFERLIEMAQAVGLPAAAYEARLGLILARSGDRKRAKEICDRLHELADSSSNPNSPNLELAEAYLELEDYEKARQHIRPAYKMAWADGPPYSRWWELNRCRTVLQSLGEPEPTLPPYDPARIKPVPYEAEIRALIVKLKNPPPS